MTPGTVKYKSDVWQQDVGVNPEQEEQECPQLIKQNRKILHNELDYTSEDIVPNCLS